MSSMSIKWGERRRRWLRHYRGLVKRQLLLNGSNKVHLAKNPVMSGWVEALIEEFPDARFVVMMRDPTECIPSCLKLVELTWKGKGWERDDYEESLRLLTRHLLRTLPQPPSRSSLHTRRLRKSWVDYRDLHQITS